MRPFDEKLLDILKTETEIEGRLKREAGFREEFMEEMMSNSQGKNPETYNRFHDKIAIGRMMRYIAWPMHKNNMIQTSFVVNGKMRMQIGGERRLPYQRENLLFPVRTPWLRRKHWERKTLSSTF
jgi:hypothetical protein